jgi:hypothetical protein
MRVGRQVAARLDRDRRDVSRGAGSWLAAQPAAISARRTAAERGISTRVESQPTRTSQRAPDSR